MAGKKGKRELIEPRDGDKRFVKRDEEGQFKESDDVGKSLAADRRTAAKTKVKAGYGDQGDQKKSSGTKSKAATGKR